MGEYKITIEYIERNEYEIKIDGEGFPCAGDIYDHYEDDPKYLVREIDGDELALVDSGQMMTEKLIADMTDEEYVGRLENYWELSKDSIVVKL